MVELYTTPLVQLIDRCRLEFGNQQTLFDLPQRKWYLPTAEDGLDLSVSFHDRRAANAVGPASGPQSQMAQNLVLSWLAGSRIMELKTVQINDQLEISRPCIDATNVGYNVEWSQELRVEDSLREYVHGAMLIHMLAHAPEEFGAPFGDTSMVAAAEGTIYDMSIGYDLKGIRSDKVRRFMDGMINAKPAIDQARQALPPRLSALRDLNYPPSLSRSVTLSTFHGCPADEIERICEYLLTDVGVHTIVKMNPPMLGKDTLEHLLYDVMGYHDLTVNPSAYTNGLQFDESVEMTGRLAKLAAEHGLGFGAKFSNTLEVENHRDFFQPHEKIMYLSGAPLHVITLTLAQKYRDAVGHEIPISFSAGVDRKNFANLVACGFAPITICTDLLKTGGYGRLPPYLTQLEKEMRALGVTNVTDFILQRHGQSQAAKEDSVRAGFLNGNTVVTATQADTRYYQEKNASIPKRIDSHLTLFDCITCYKCIPVCPNDANFFYETDEVDITYRDLEVQGDGTVQEVGEPKKFQLERSEQIANFADYCNHCGNCDTFCPEYDGPYLMKPSFFGSRQAFDEAAEHDGFFLETDGDTRMLWGRIEGVPLRLTSDGDRLDFDDGNTHLTNHGGGWSVIECRRAGMVDMGKFYAMSSLLRGILRRSRIHPVNVAQ